MGAEDKDFGPVSQMDLTSASSAAQANYWGFSNFWGRHQGMQNPYENYFNMYFHEINKNLEVTKSYVVQGGFNSWVLRGNPVVWLFIWKLLSSTCTFLWWCLLCCTCTRWLWFLGLLRCFDTVFRRPYQYFSIALKVILSLSNHCKIFSTDWLWIEVCQNAEKSISLWQQ